MATATGLTIVKRFTYRGDPNEEYSNTYWFKPVTPPSTPADWKTLFDAVVAGEKTLYPSSVSVIRGYGYADDAGHKPGDTGAVAPAAWTEDLTVSPLTPVAGNLATSGAVFMPGDSAVWVRWKTNRLTVKGKAIYVRKYFHPAATAGTSPFDVILPLQRTNLLAFGALLDGGTLPTARTITTAGRLDTMSSHDASQYVTTRTLKRRGKRP